MYLVRTPIAGKLREDLPLRIKENIENHTRGGANQIPLRISGGF